MSFSNQYFLNNFSWFDAPGNNFSWIPFDGMQGPPSTGVFINPYSDNGMNAAQAQMLNPGSAFGVQEMDMYPEDGWELIKINLGYTPDLTPLVPSEFPDVPYIILYNKYRGILRVFAKTFIGLTSPTTYKTAKIILEFDQNYNPALNAGDSDYSNTFMMSGELAQPLDQPTKITKLINVAEHPNNYQKWFYADFELAYDACACFYRSDLRLSFEFVNSSDVKLAGRSVSIEDELLDNNLNVKYDNGFLTNVFEDPSGFAQSGSVIYGTMDQMVDDYLNKLEAYKASLQDYNKIQNVLQRQLVLVLWKAVKTYGVSFAASALSAPAAAILINLSILNLRKLGVLDLDAYANGSVKVNKDVLKKKMKEFFGEQVNKLTADFTKNLDPGAPKQPSMPTAIFSEMSMAGSITSSSRVDGPRFFNPGTYNCYTVNTVGTNFSTSTPVTNYVYPTYNQAVGIFSLLRTPRLEQYVEEDYSPNLVIVPGNNIPNYYVQYTYKNVYRLKEPLLYALNPALNINWAKSSIRVALSYSDSTGLYLDPSNIPLQLEKINVQSNVSAGGKYDYISPFLNIDCFSGSVFGNENVLLLLLDQYGQVDPQIPPNLSYQFNLLVQNGVAVPDLKILVDLELFDLGKDGEPVSITQVYTFRTIPELVSNDITNDHDFVNFTAIPLDLTINSTHYTEDITITAVETITIEGEITCEPGVIVNFIAGNEIILTPEAEIIPSVGGEINMSIQSVLPCDEPMPMASVQSITSFCQSSEYTAKTAAPGFRRPMPNSSEPIAAHINLEVRSVSQGAFLLVSENDTDQNQYFKVYDSYGRIVHEANRLPNSLDLTSVASGVYLFEFVTENGRKVQRVFVD